MRLVYLNANGSLHFPGTKHFETALEWLATVLVCDSVLLERELGQGA